MRVGQPRRKSKKKTEGEMRMWRKMVSKKEKRGQTVKEVAEEECDG